MVSRFKKNTLNLCKLGETKRKKIPIQPRFRRTLNELFKKKKKMNLCHKFIKQIGTECIPTADPESD